VATPLALVLAELLQNALQHGLAQSLVLGSTGTLEVIVSKRRERLVVRVCDNGAGLPEDFDLDSTTSLGLQIVRTLVVAELGGRLEVRPRVGGGTEAVVDLPLETLVPLPGEA
jgi:two-component sensor histidine kinase